MDVGIACYISAIDWSKKTVKTIKSCFVCLFLDLQLYNFWCRLAIRLFSYLVLYEN